MTKFNEQFQSIIAPVIIIFIFVNVIGLLGNIVVLNVYSLRYPKTRFRCLVLALCYVDMTSCCTTVPMETISTWFWFDSPSRILCKMKNFFVQLTALSAMYMLFVTAVYKYRQICKPFQKQLTQKLLVIMIICGIACSLIFALPAAFLWDINNHTIEINNASVPAFICEVHQQFGDTAYPTVYRHFLSAYSIYLLTTIVLYISVAKTTISHVRLFKTKTKTTQRGGNWSVTTVSRVVSHIRVSDIANSHCNHSTHSYSSGSISSQQEAVMPGKLPKRVKNSKTTSSSSKLSATQLRKLVIMVVISGIFSVTFIMGLSFGYIFATRDNSDYHSLEEIILMFSCYRLYFINYALNPIVYFTLDRRFRAEVLRLMLCFRNSTSV